MTTDSLEALMNRELDGENSPRESARLRERLDADPAARSRFAEMENAFRVLEEAETFDPPEELRGRILAAFDREVTEGADRGEVDSSAADRPGNGPVRATPFRRLRLRPGYAFAAVAGFLLGLLVWQQTGPGDAGRQAMPDAWLRGSQLERTGAAPDGPVTVPVAGGGARGRFRIWRGATSDLVSLELEAETPIRLELSADLAVRFQDLQARPAGAWNLSAAPGAAALEGKGSCACVFVVEKSGRLVRGLAWRLLAEGEIVDRGELSIRDRGESP